MMEPLSNIRENSALRKQEFPCMRDGVFLAHAAVCPLPERSAKAMSLYVHQATGDDQEARFPSGTMVQTRKDFARMLGCSAEEISLVAPTSTALSMVAAGLDWKPGDNVVFYPDDYPSNAVPWMALKEKGVEPREIKVKHLGHITLEDLKPLVDSNTRLVSLASVHFISGCRLDMDGIGEWLRSKGVLFCVDGIQSVGALRTDVRHVDFLAADAHKWMLGPCAAGVFYVSKSAQEKLRPMVWGWHNVHCPDFVTPEKVEFVPGARRYEAGSPNLIGLVGLHASLQILQDWGLENVHAALIANTRYLREKLKELDVELAGIPEGDERLSGITSFTSNRVDPRSWMDRLTRAGIRASLRQTRDRRYWIRLSPHAYNTLADLDRVLEVLK